MAFENDDNNGDGDSGAGGGDAGTGGGASAADLVGGTGGTGGGEGGGDAGAGGAGGAASEAGGSGGDGGGGGSDPEWYGNLSADADGENASNRDWIKAKGFKDLDGVTKALRSAEQAIHDSGRVKIPGEGASEEEVAAFRKTIGVPDDAKGYELPQPKGEDGEPVPLNTAMLERVAAAAHKAGIPKGALEAVLSEEVQAQLDEHNAQESEISQRAAAHVKKWGKEADDKLAAVDNALSALGLNKEKSLAIRAAIGPEEALDMFARLGAGLSEDRMVGGDKRRFGISASEAQAEMDKLKTDGEFQKKVMVPGSAENLRWKRLQDAVGAEADRRAASGE